MKPRIRPPLRSGGAAARSRRSQHFPVPSLEPHCPSQAKSSLWVIHHSTLPQRADHFDPKTLCLYSKDLTFLNKTAPLPRYYGLGPTPRFAFASARSPKFLSELSTRVPPMPRRVSTTQVDSMVSCWLHDVRTLATRNFGNETLRRRFICIIAYPFVRRDSRTSVADYASLRLCRPTASIRLCTPRLPNCMLTSLQCRLLSSC